MRNKPPYTHTPGSGRPSLGDQHALRQAFKKTAGKGNALQGDAPATQVIKQVIVQQQGGSGSGAGGVPPSRQVLAGTGLDGGGALDEDVTLDLADTAVTAGTYHSPNLTIDAQGRATAASESGIVGDGTNAEVVGTIKPGGYLSPDGSAGIDATVALAPLTTGGTAGSAVFSGGILTAYTAPT